MKLACSSIAEKAFFQEVDLQRLFCELVEAVAFNENSLRIRGGMRGVPHDNEALLARIRSMDYESLSDGKWKQVIFGDGEFFSESCILDHIQSLINAFGRFVQINNKQDLQIAIQALRTIDPSTPLTVFLQCLAETAVNQQLDAEKIGMVEMRRVRSETDIDLIRDNTEIVGLTREKMDVLLGG